MLIQILIWAIQNPKKLKSHLLVALINDHVPYPLICHDSVSLQCMVIITIHLAYFFRHLLSVVSIDTSYSCLRHSKQLY